MNYIYFSWFTKLIKKVTDFLFNDLILRVFSWIMDGVAKVMSFVMETVYNYIFKPILLPILETFWHWIWEMINIELSKILYTLEIYFLRFIDAIMELFDELVGVKELSFDGGKTSRSIIEYLIEDQAIKNAIAGFFMLGFILLLITSVMATIRTTYDDGENGQRNTLGKVWKNIGKAMVKLATAPIYVSFLVSLSVILASATSNIVEGNKAYNYSGKITFGSSIFVASTFSFDNAANERFTAGVRKDYLYNANGKDYTSGFDNVKRDFPKIDIWTSVLGVVLGLIVLFALIKVLYALICRLFDIVVLYLTFPFFCATIPIDDGEKYKRWSDMLVARIFITNGTYLVFLVTQSIFLPWIVDLPVDIGNNAANYILKIVLIIGVLTNISNFPQLAQGLFSYEAASLDVENQNTMGGIVKSLVGSAINKLTEKGDDDKDSDGVDIEIVDRDDGKDELIRKGLDDLEKDIKNYYK